MMDHAPCVPTDQLEESSTASDSALLADLIQL